jgi:hypothetical protein
MTEKLIKTTRVYYSIKEMPNTKFGGVTEVMAFVRLLESPKFSRTSIYSNGNKIKKTFYV